MESTTNITTFGEEMLKERYYYKDENTPLELFTRIAKAGGSDKEHTNRLISYMNKGWFIPSTPILSNLGTNRGLPISCFVNEVEDSKEGIFDTYNENFNLGANGGGIGTDWSNIREIGATVGDNGKSSGIIPFIKVSDSSTLAVSQGGLRRASQVVYLDVSHPEVKEFLDIRRPKGDINRQSLNIHHGVKLTDEFMEAVNNLDKWDLISPSTNEVVESVEAFELFTKILDSRVETGEPFIFFSDNVKKAQPFIYEQHGLEVTTSNLCTEIMLPTSANRSAVCCLASINLAKWEELEGDTNFLRDVVEFLDNVLDEFVKKAKAKQGFAKAIKSVINERSIGIGVMGWHTLLQEKHIPLESLVASLLNKSIFSYLRTQIHLSSHLLGVKKGFAPIYKDIELTDVKRRNTCTMAIAPTSSISIIGGEVSAGIEPILANAYTHKNILGTTIIKNKTFANFLTAHREIKGLPVEWEDEQWKSIIENEGSVQHLEWMNKWDKDVFKTAFEIDQNWLIELGADRQEFIDQGQSLNLFIHPDEQKAKIYKLHYTAWKKGIKSLYYCRSMVNKRANIKKTERKVIDVTTYDECLVCQ